MDTVGVPQHDVERGLSPSHDTAIPPAAGSSGVAAARSDCFRTGTVHFHHYHGPVNHVGTAINSNLGVNNGVIQQNAHIQCRPSSSNQHIPESGTGASSGGAPSSPGLAVSHRSNLSALLNPLSDASHTRDRKASPPNSRCFEGTRKKVIKKINSWINSNLLLGGTHIMWVYGYAGCGKSAIAQVIAEDLSHGGRLAGSFFFFRGSGDRDRITRLATTIASQLAAAIPATAEGIRDAIAANPGLLSTEITMLGPQFQHLVYEPLNACTVGRDRAEAAVGRGIVLIVLDGVDECEDREQVTAFIEHTIKFFDKNPLTPLRFLITSRVEDHLYQRLHSSKQVKLLNLVKHTSDIDISAALDAAIDDEKRKLSYACELAWPSKNDKKKLVEHIGGSYIFMTTLIRMLFDQSTDDGQTPMQRLPQLLSVKPDFDSLYTRTLKVSERLPHFHDILSIIALAQEPLSIVQIAAVLSIKTFPVSRVLANLHAIMQVPGDDRSPVTLWHTSLRDFLRSKDRAGPSFFAGPIHHLHLALRCNALFHGTPQSPADPSWKGYVSRHVESHLERFAEGWDNATLSFDAGVMSSLADALGQPCFIERRTAIEYACLEQRWVLAEALVAASTSVAVQYQFRNKPESVLALHECATHNKHAIARFLLEHGADPNAKNSDGGTPLHYASAYGHVEVIQHLLEFGADPNIQDGMGWTPLHKACYWEYVEPARLLLDHNADPSIKTAAWGTPLQIARDNRRESITAFFHERGITK